MLRHKTSLSLYSLLFYSQRSANQQVLKSSLSFTRSPVGETVQPPWRALPLIRLETSTARHTAGVWATVRFSS